MQRDLKRRARELCIRDPDQQLKLHRLAALRARGKGFVFQESYFVRKPMLFVTDDVDSAAGYSETASITNLAHGFGDPKAHCENLFTIHEP